MHVKAIKAMVFIVLRFHVNYLLTLLMTSPWFGNATLLGVKNGIEHNPDRHYVSSKTYSVKQIGKLQHISRNKSVSITLR